MGPVRHRQLIRLLALVVSIDLVVGVAALYTRGGPASAAGPKERTARSGGQSPDAAALGVGAAPGEILSGMKFSKRGASEKGSTAPSTSGGSATSSSSARGPAPTAGSSTSSSSRATTSTTRPPTTTSTTRAATSSTAPATTTSNSGPARPAQFKWIPADDTAGDPVIDGTTKRKDEGRADIVRTQAAYTASLIVLNMKTAQTVDPSQDPNWSSTSTFQSWELDVNGDGDADFEVQYHFAEDTVTAGISRVGDLETDSVCQAEAQYWSGGYAIGFDAACVGSPAAFSYRAKMFFDTEPANPDADVITDTAPNGGMSRPVTRESE